MNVWCLPLPPLGPVPGLHLVSLALVGFTPRAAAIVWAARLAPVVHEWRYVIGAGADVELSVTIPTRHARYARARMDTARAWGRAAILAACERDRVLPAHIMMTVTYDTATVDRWGDAALYLRSER